MKILWRRVESRKMRQSTEPARAPSAEEGRPGGSWRESIVFQIGNIVKGCLTKYLCVLSKCNCELVLSQVWARVKTQLRSIATDLPSGEGVCGPWGFPAKCGARGRSGSGAVNNGWKKSGKTKTKAIAIVSYTHLLNVGGELDVCFELPC